MSESRKASPGSKRTPAARSGAESLDGLFASGEGCVLVTGGDLEVVFASESAESMFGQKRERLLGQKLEALLDGMTPLPAQGVRHGGFSARARRGATGVPVRVLWAREGDRLQFLVLDVHKLADRPLGVAVSDLARFASMVAHEIRNPLSSVKIVIQTLARAPDRSMDERAERRLAIAAREIRTVERILSALSELAHAAELRLAETEIEPIVAEALQTAEVELADRSVLVRTDIAPGLPRIVVDPYKVRVALTHLLVNAAHAIGVGGEIRLEAHPAHGGVTLTVRDTAPLGATQASGAGISLEMVSRIARVHGGYLKIAGGEHGGTDCSLFLPSVPAS